MDENKYIDQFKAIVGDDEMAKAFLMTFGRAFIDMGQRAGLPFPSFLTVLRALTFATEITIAELNYGLS